MFSRLEVLGPKAKLVLFKNALRGDWTCWPIPTRPNALKAFGLWVWIASLEMEVQADEPTFALAQERLKAEWPQIES